MTTNTPATIVGQDEMSVSLMWEGSHGGPGTVVVADGVEYTISAVTGRGFVERKFHTWGLSWTAEYLEREAAKKAADTLRGRRAATTDRY